MTASIPVSVALHAGVGSALNGSASNEMLVALLVLGGLASVALVGLGALAFSRRRSRSYLLITLALAALAFKAFLGGLWVMGLMATMPHHLLEHGMDLAIAGLLIAAIYDARTAPGERGSETEEVR